MKCKICNSDTKPLHKGLILNKYKIQYFNCHQCGFTQTEEPYWLEEAYSDAISISDTGIMARNNIFSKKAKVLLSLLCDKHGKFLDFGGGYGIFTRLMRDNGFDFFWYDKYATNLVARGFEGKIDNKNSYKAITSFENFEHLLNPLEDIEIMLGLSDMVIFSTELMPVELPEPNKWWYYCLEHGQHISIFSKKSLEHIAQKNNFNFVSDSKNLHIFSKIKVSPMIFFITKIIIQLGLHRLIKNKPKMNDDMSDMIKKMKLR